MLCWFLPYNNEFSHDGGLVTKSCPTLVIPWTVACQAPLSMEFPGNNTGMGCQFLLQGNLPDPGIEPMSPALPADSLPVSGQESPV